MISVRFLALVVLAVAATAASVSVAGPGYDYKKGEDLTGKYPWWTGVELGNPKAKVRVEAFLSYTCPHCGDTWRDIVLPIIAKYGKRISFIFQPFALPYQPYSYDATCAALGVYRLKGNDTQAFLEYSSIIMKNQMVVYGTFDMTQREVWTKYFGAWAEPFGIKTEDLMAAMYGNITTANYDAWYLARFTRQRTLPGAPTFIINGWIPWDLDPATWKLSDWEKWLDKNIE